MYKRQRYDGLNPNSTYTINWGTSPQMVRNGITYEQFSDHLWAIVPENGEANTRVFVRDMIRFEDEDIPDEDSRMDTSGGGRRKKSHKKSYRKKITFRRVISKKRKLNKRPTKRCRKTKTKSKRRKTRRRH